MNFTNIKKVSDYIWEIPPSTFYEIKVPVRIYGTKSLLQNMGIGVIKQICNVSSLPGVVKAVYCMPDGHIGYGFPIGGVAAMDPNIGVISPGGIGFDVNCGMRLISTNLNYAEIKPNILKLVNRLFEAIPSGVGGNGILKFSRKEFEKILEQGASWLVRKGYGWCSDIESTEDQGCVKGANVSKISSRAIERGLKQVGSLGSGNHYLEIQVIRKGDIFDNKTAEKLGINKVGQVFIMFHCGSRGLGHQIATDYSRKFLKLMKRKYGILVYDKNLSCAPFRSKEGQDYFAAMKCAANMAYANRQVILYKIREVFSKFFSKTPRELGLYQIIDVSHNIARLEKHLVDGKPKELLLHRKGATRALGPNAIGFSSNKYLNIGQPTIVSGSMETGSYLLVGTNIGANTFYSTAHGSGRKISRKQARKKFDGNKLITKMSEKGIYVKTKSLENLSEEAGNAYKNIDEIVNTLIYSGISKPIARFSPVGNIKG